MTVNDFERQFWEVEGIRLVVRAPGATQLANYDYQRAADQAWTLHQLLTNRIEPCLEGLEVAFIDGTGAQPRRNQRLRTARASYNNA